MAITYLEEERLFQLDTENTSYIIGIVDEENFVGHVYYGKKIRCTNAAYLMRTGEAPFVPSVNNRERLSFLDSFPMEYPGNGLGDYRESAIEVKTVKGHAGIQLGYESYEILNEKPELKGLPSTFAGEEACQTLVLHCEDAVLDLRADLLYTVFEKENVITRSVVLHYDGTEPLFLTKIMSASLDMDNKEYEMVTLHGSWAKERQI